MDKGDGRVVMPRRRSEPPIARISTPPMISVVARRRAQSAARNRTYLMKPCSRRRSPPTAEKRRHDHTQGETLSAGIRWQPQQHVPELPPVHGNHREDSAELDHDGKKTAPGGWTQQLLNRSRCAVETWQEFGQALDTPRRIAFRCRSWGLAIPCHHYRVAEVPIVAACDDVTVMAT